VGWPAFACGFRIFVHVCAHVYEAGALDGLTHSSRCGRSRRSGRRSGRWRGARRWSGRSGSARCPGMCQRRSRSRSRSHCSGVLSIEVYRTPRCA
jgi:hypothetical protein